MALPPTPPQKPPMGGAPAQGGKPQISPDEAKGAIMEAINQLRQVCARYGFNLEELMSQSGKGTPPRTVPMPPQQ